MVGRAGAPGGSPPAYVTAVSRCRRPLPRDSHRDPRAHLSVWLTTVQKPHVIQHKLAGVCAFLAGAIESSRACRWLAAPQWRWALPLLTIAAGLAIGVHGGTHQHLPRVAEQAHHWILGGALVLGGMVHAVAIGHVSERSTWQRVLPALVLAAGLDLALLYRLR
jgi:hypothetical protein